MPRRLEELPRELREKVAEKVQADKARSAKTGSAGSPGERPPERTRILVVDDEEAILETMAFTFEDDYDVVTSASPRDALAKLERTRRSRS